MANGDFVIAVGEEVGVGRWHHSSGRILNSKFGTVTKINGHGHIFVQVGDEILCFNKRGLPYKNEWGPSLIHAAQLRSQLEIDARRQEQVRIAREIETKMKEGYSYSGRFFVSQDRVDALKNLVAELEKLVD